MFNLFPIYPIFALWIFSAACTIALICGRQFKTSQLWQVGHLRELKAVLIRFTVAAVLLGGYVVAFEPDLLFNFPRYRPHTWTMVMILYPLLSVCPQGLTHRAFLFHRYQLIFRGGWMIFASAAAFSFMHIVFKNPLALLLTFAGGLLFAKTYTDSRSLIVSLVEHALYGNYIFTIGLGKYLYLGAAGYGLSGLP
jgi:membrane protease YdiL (CAAX protease family)